MTHLSPSFWVHTTSKCSDKSSWSQTKAPCEKLCFLFWDEDIAFLGHIKWSTKHSGNNQRGTVKDTRSQVLEAVNISTPAPPPLSFSARRSWYTSIVHPVLTSRVYCFFFVFFNLFRYSLITIHSVKKNSTRQQWESFWILSGGMHPCFITYDARQMRHWWGLQQTTLCFPVTAQPDWFMCIPLGQRKTFLHFYTSFHLICNSAIYGGMRENM